MGSNAYPNEEKFHFPTFYYIKTKIFKSNLKLLLSEWDQVGRDFTLNQ